MALNEGGDGEDETMGDVIFCDFGEARRITRVEYEAAAVRLEREAAIQPSRTAEQLRRLADTFRKRAEGAVL